MEDDSCFSLTLVSDSCLKPQYHSCTYDMKACESVFDWEVCVCVCVRVSDRVSEWGREFGENFVLLGYNLSCPTVYHNNKTILHEMKESL